MCDATGAACQSGSAAPDVDDWLVFFQHAGFFEVESIAIQPGYDFPEHDVAVIRLAEPRARHLADAARLERTGARDRGHDRRASAQSAGGEGDYGLKRRGERRDRGCGSDLPEASSAGTS